MSLREYRNRDHDGGECSYDPESGPLTKDLDVHDKNMVIKGKKKQFLYNNLHICNVIISS